MTHDRETAEVIDLGKVSTETLGTELNPRDETFGGQSAGLSDD
ncbi:benenodin family lasso peptide [Novosphingobium resinovorum]|nr:benenodin family lasso peptide [Novosphingobium resinovorum]